LVCRAASSPFHPFLLSRFPATTSKRPRSDEEGGADGPAASAEDFSKALAAELQHPGVSEYMAGPVAEAAVLEFAHLSMGDSVFEPADAFQRFKVTTRYMNFTVTGDTLVELQQAILKDRSTLVPRLLAKAETVKTALHALAKAVTNDSSAVDRDGPDETIVQYLQKLRKLAPPPMDVLEMDAETDSANGSTRSTLSRNSRSTHSTAARVAAMKAKPRSKPRAAAARSKAATARIAAASMNEDLEAELDDQAECSWPVKKPAGQQQQQQPAGRAPAAGDRTGTSRAGGGGGRAGGRSRARPRPTKSAAVGGQHAAAAAAASAFAAQAGSGVSFDAVPLEAPRVPPTAFQLFRRVARHNSSAPGGLQVAPGMMDTASEYDHDDDLSTTDEALATYLTNEWYTIGPEQRVPYEDQASELRRQYEYSLAAYKQQRAFGGAGGDDPLDAFGTAGGDLDAVVNNPGFRNPAGGDGACSDTDLALGAGMTMDVDLGFMPMDFDGEFNAEEVDDWAMCGEALTSPPVDKNGDAQLDAKTVDQLRGALDKPGSVRKKKPAPESREDLMAMCDMGGLVLPSTVLGSDVPAFRKPWFDGGAGRPPGPPGTEDL